MNSPFIYPHGTSIADSLAHSKDNTNGIGQRLRKIDGLDKATGKTQFVDDIQMPGMLHAKIKRSTKSHARILSIDVTDAEKIPGVFAIVTGQEMPVPYGVIPWTKDEHALCLEKVRYIGDAIAAVAAVDEETANRALKSIKVYYHELPAILSAEEAATTGQTPETKVNEKAKTGNITKHVSLQFGDVEKALNESDVTVENTFYFSNTTHAPIEPHCAIAEYNHRGLLTVISSTQVPHYLHKALSEVLEIPESLVRVIQPAVGGAFGGKSEPFDLEFVVAKLAMKTGRPVKCLYTREEVFYSHRGRHPMRMHFRCGASSQGKIKAVKSQIAIDGGAYASFGMVTAFYAGQLLTGPVGFETYAFDATRYYTNKPACGPKRGHGSVQPRFALEIHLDMLAEKLQIDPIDLRLQNAVPAHSTTINGQAVGSLGLGDCLKAIRQASNWDNRRAQKTDGRGLGVASSMYISGTNYPVHPNEMPQTGVQVKIDRSGRVTLFCGASDIGQGSNSILAQIAGEELGVALEHVKVVASDTDLTPVDLGSYSSRVTLMMGHAAQEACRKLRIQIQNAVATKWKIEPEQILFGHEKVWCQKDTSLCISLTEAFQLTECQYGTLGSTGSYRTVKRGGDYRGGTIGSSPAYSCTAHIADVEVDPATGRLVVHKIWVAHDCGKALNPMLVEGQIEGSTYMGFAEVALEEMQYGSDKARRGMLINPSLLDYRIPTSLDTPQISAFVIENPDPNGPYGAKEAGEGPLHSSIPAIANAIYDAVGIRLFELPFSPDKIRQALEMKKKP